MRRERGLVSPPAVGLPPVGAAGAEGLAVDVVAGASCVGVAILILHRVVSATGVLSVVGSRGLYFFLAAAVAAVPLGFAAAHRGPLAGYPALRQFLRYGCTGLLNTAIDFGTLNLLVLMTGVYGGIRLVSLHVVAFAATSLNSFTWNKLWTFRRRGRAHLLRELAEFYTVAVGGVAVSSSILWAITTLIPRPEGVLPIVWVNGAKLAAGVCAIAWNFVWYRSWVFRVRSPHLPADPHLFG